MTGLVGAESQSWRLTLKARLRNTANIYYLDKILLILYY